MFTMLSSPCEPGTRVVPGMMVAVAVAMTYLEPEPQVGGVGVLVKVGVGVIVLVGVRVGHAGSVNVSCNPVLREAVLHSYWLYWLPVSLCTPTLAPAPLNPLRVP